MKRVVVLGGGPAGALAAERIAQAGVETILLDEKLAWEKPCGGGLTYKAYSRYPFLIENDRPKRLVSEMRVAAPGAGWASLRLSRPLVIYSRLDLNRMLLERAEQAGARLEKARVLEIVPRDDGWLLKTNRGAIEAGFAIVATGARNQLRNVGTEWRPGDTMCALGYYIPEQQDQIDIQFLPQLEGYIWIFPRCGHLSAGICGKGLAAQVLRARLESFLEERGASWKNGQFYGHRLPSLETLSWIRNRVAGPGWLAVGDAGGLVDPITGEGLYYALRSADLASQVVLDETHPPAEKHRAYRGLLMRDFAADLAFGSSLVKRFFSGRFLFGSITARTVQFARHSQRFRAVLADLMEGALPYRNLKTRLFEGLRATLFETALDATVGRLRSVSLKRPARA